MMEAFAQTFDAEIRLPPSSSCSPIPLIQLKVRQPQPHNQRAERNTNQCASSPPSSLSSPSTVAVYFPYNDLVTRTSSTHANFLKDQEIQRLRNQIGYLQSASALSASSASVVSPEFSEDYFESERRVDELRLRLETEKRKVGALQAEQVEQRATHQRDRHRLVASAERTKTELKSLQREYERTTRQNRELSEALLQLQNKVSTLSEVKKELEGTIAKERTEHTKFRINSKIKEEEALIMHDKYKKMLHELNTMESLIESKATEARAVSMERERTMLQQEAELHILQQQMEAMQGESKEREDKLLRNPTLNNTKRDNESMDVDAKGNVSTVKIPRIEMDPITNERMSMYEREMSNKRFECMRQEYLSLRRQSKRETDALTVTAAQAQEALSVNISGKTHNSPDQRESEQGAVRNSSNTDRNSRKRRSDSMKMARKILRSLRPWVGIQIIAGPKDGVKVLTVKDNSPAMDAGCRVGDVIELADGSPTVHNEQFKDVIRQVKVGDTVTFMIQRTHATRTEGRKNCGKNTQTNSSGDGNDNLHLHHHSQDEADRGSVRVKDNPPMQGFSGKCSGNTAIISVPVKISSRTVEFSDILRVRRIGKGVMSQGDEVFIRALYNTCARKRNKPSSTAGKSASHHHHRRNHSHSQSRNHSNLSQNHHHHNRNYSTGSINISSISNGSSTSIDRSIRSSNSSRDETTEGSFSSLNSFSDSSVRDSISSTGPNSHHISSERGKESIPRSDSSRHRHSNSKKSGGTDIGSAGATSQVSNETSVHANANVSVSTTSDRMISASMVDTSAMDNSFAGPGHTAPLNGRENHPFHHHHHQHSHQHQSPDQNHIEHQNHAYDPNPRHSTESPYPLPTQSGAPVSQHSNTIALKHRVRFASPLQNSTRTYQYDGSTHGDNDDDDNSREQEGATGSSRNDSTTSKNSNGSDNVFVRPKSSDVDHSGHTNTSGSDLSLSFNDTSHNRSGASNLSTSSSFSLSLTPNSSSSLSP